MRGVIGRYAYELISSGRAVSAMAIDPDAFAAWAEEHVAGDDDDVSRLAALFTWAAVSYVDDPSLACTFRLNDGAPFPFDDPVLTKHHLRVIKATSHDRTAEEESDLLSMIMEGAPMSRVFEFLDTGTSVGIDDETRLTILEDLRLTLTLVRFLGDEREEGQISDDKFKRLLKRIKTRAGRRAVVEEHYLEQYNAMAPFPS
jgi:hypothetical protein